MLFEDSSHSICTDLEGKKGPGYVKGRILPFQVNPRDFSKKGDVITQGHKISPDSSIIFHDAPWDVNSASPY